ncbi:MAG: hypothetical protein Tsb009_33380 [Planctomycetaceae bacterium]
MTDDFKIIQTGERCRNLQSKGMYINAGLPPGEEAVGDGHFWCGLNQETYGPDNRLCDGENCTDATRSCYEAP